MLKDPRDKEDDEDADSYPESFLSIRSSTATWQSAYHTSHETTQEKLMVVNPTVLGVLNLWHQFSGIRLIDFEGIVSKGSAFELKSFKSMVLQRFEKTYEKLMNNWYPAVLNVFYEGIKQNEWNKIPSDRLESFFKMISLIVADQLRYIITESVNEFVALFDGNPASVSDRIPNAKPPAFAFTLNLEDSKIKFEPSLSEFQSTIESLFDHMLLALDKVPKVETQLFFSGQTANINNRAALSSLRPDQCIRVAYENTYPTEIANARKTLKANLTRLMQAPQVYLGEFDKHNPLIFRTADVEVAEFLKTEPTFDKMTEEVKKYRSQANNQILFGYPFTVSFPLAQLNGEQFIKDLAERAIVLAGQILEKMAGDNRATNANTIAEFETVAAKLLREPNGVEELVTLQKSLENSRAVELKILEESVEEARKR